MVDEEEMVAAAAAREEGREYMNDSDPSVLRFLIAAREEVESTQARLFFHRKHRSSTSSVVRGIKSSQSQSGPKIGWRAASPQNPRGCWALGDC